MHDIKDTTENKNVIKDMSQNDMISDVFNKIPIVCSALYMITDHIKDTEPIKDMIRSESVVLIKDTGVLSETNNSIPLKNRITTIRALLEVAQTLGIISFANVGILLQELHKIQDKITKEVQPISIEKLFASVHAETIDMPPAQKAIFTGVFKGTKEELINTLSDQERSDKRHDEIKTNEDKRQQKIADIALRNERRTTILKLIKDNKEITVKDMMRVIKDWSAKTIQRELMSLVDEKVLKKNGDKRWATYSIKL